VDVRRHGGEAILEREERNSLMNRSGSAVPNELSVIKVTTAQPHEQAEIVRWSRNYSQSHGCDV
jgi:hypothetical protein